MQDGDMLPGSRMWWLFEGFEEFCSEFLAVRFVRVGCLGFLVFVLIVVDVVVEGVEEGLDVVLNGSNWKTWLNIFFYY